MRFIVFGLALLLAPAAQAFLIDEFDDFQPLVSASSFQAVPVPGGEREVLFISAGMATVEVIGGAVEVVAGSAVPASVQLAYDGDDSSSAISFGLGAIDLTDGGLSDRVVVEISELTGSFMLGIRVSDQSGVFSGLDTVVSAPGVYEFPFSSLYAIGGGSSFAGVNGLSLTIADLELGESVQIDHFGTRGADFIDTFTNVQPLSSSTVFQDDADVLGGERDVQIIGAEFEVIDGVGVLTSTTTFPSAQIIYDGEDGSIIPAQGLPLLDLSRGGRHDRFRFTLPEADPSTVTVRVRGPGGLGQGSVTVPGPGVHDLRFEDFLLTTKFQAATQIDVLVSSLSTGEFVAIDRVETAGPIVLDEFSDDQAPILNPGGPLEAFHETEAVVGGERDARFSFGYEGSFDVVDGKARFSTTNSMGSILLTYDGVDGSGSDAYDLGAVDLTDGGAVDAFVVEVADVVGTVTLLWTVGNSLADSDFTSISIDTPGVHEVLFADFTGPGTPADFTTAELIRIAVRDMEPGESIELDRIGLRTSVPEPGRAMSLVAGLWLLGRLARRRGRG